MITACQSNESLGEQASRQRQTMPYLRCNGLGHCKEWERKVGKGIPVCLHLLALHHLKQLQADKACIATFPLHCCVCKQTSSKDISWQGPVLCCMLCHRV